MAASTADESPAGTALLQRAAAGDVTAWGDLLAGHAARLGRMVAFRLDPRLQGRVDAADVVQDAFLAVSPDAYFRLSPPVPSLFLWLRGVAGNKLLEVHRYHLGTHMRDARRETAINGSDAADATSAALVDQLSGHVPGPHTEAVRCEVRDRLHRALSAMDSIDREVLALRHFEQLTNGEAAAVLKTEERAAAQRYVRALKRLKAVLAEMPGGLTEIRP